MIQSDKANCGFNFNFTELRLEKSTCTSKVFKGGYQRVLTKSKITRSSCLHHYVKVQPVRPEKRMQTMPCAILSNPPRKHPTDVLNKPFLPPLHSPASKHCSGLQATGFLPHSSHFLRNSATSKPTRLFAFSQYSSSLALTCLSTTPASLAPEPTALEIMPVLTMTAR